MSPRIAFNVARSRLHAWLLRRVLRWGCPECGAHWRWLHQATRRPESLACDVCGASLRIDKPGVRPVTRWSDLPP